MKSCLILVDNSNVFIEGKKLSARKKGMKADLGQIDPIDWSWRIDFGSLLREIANGNPIIEAILVGSTPRNDSLWESARIQGFTVKTYERGYSGQEKAIDTALSVRGTKIITKHPEPSILKLISGDRDFVPLIEVADEEGWETELWGFSSSISHNLAEIVTRVKTLDSVFDIIGKSE
jgi:uncharacterized LabA/DUF88 family protein